MTEKDRGFLHSLHPILADELKVQQSSRYELEKIPCCYLLRDSDDDQHILKLNESGVLIWQLCNEARSVGEIVDLLTDAFEQVREDMARDVSRVVSYLLEENALVDKG